MGFFLFLLVNAALFIRPGEVVPDLADYQIYLYLMLLCLAVSGAEVLQRVNGQALREEPITLCVLGVGVTVVTSLLAQLYLRGAWERGFEFFKVVLYYLLLITVIDTPERLRRFLLCLGIFIVVLAGLSVLGYHGAVELPGASYVADRRLDQETGEMVTYLRMQGAGIFNDPNDLCLALSMGVIICLYAAGDRRFGMFRLLWLLPVGLFAYGIKLTESRGGMLGALVGVLLLLRARFGWRKALVLSAPLIAAVMMLAGGRQGGFDVEASDDTAQQRVQLWYEGMVEFRASPLFGVGAGNYAEATGSGLVAHNSFVHSYTELGFFGGACFLGAFYFAFWPLERLFAKRVTVLDPDMRRLHVYITAILAAYMAGIWSLSRCYAVPTYIGPGLAAAYLRQVQTWPPLKSLGFTQDIVWRLVQVGAAGVLVIYVTIRVLIR